MALSASLGPLLTWNPPVPGRLVRNGTGGLLFAVLALIVSSFVLAGGGERHFDSKGISFDYPASWYVTTRPLSNGLQPIYRFAVANFRVHRTGRDSGPCLAGIARQRRQDGVLAFSREATGADAKLSRFPPRPQSFSLPKQSDQSGCLGRGTATVVFRDSGRAFYLWISVGPKATNGDRRALKRLLEGMTISARD
jgi:hypothetical protein